MGSVSPLPPRLIDQRVGRADVGQLAGQADERAGGVVAADAQLLELDRAGIDRVGIDRAGEGDVDGLRRLVGARLAADRVEVDRGRLVHQIVAVTPVTSGGCRFTYSKAPMSRNGFLPKPVLGTFGSSMRMRPRESRWPLIGV